MIYFIISIPFIAFFVLLIILLEKTKKIKFLHSFLQMLSGPLIMASCIGPIFLSLCVEKHVIAVGIRWYSTAIVFICDVIGAIIYFIIAVR